MGTLDFLDSLEAPAATAISIPLRDVMPDPKQPRTRYREIDGNVSVEGRDHIKNLAKSIADQGLLQPITVREVDGGYMIVMGECRWRAFVLNQEEGIPGHEAIPAFVRNDMSPAKLRLAQLAENLNRDDLTDLEVAHFVKETLEENPELKKSELGAIMRQNSQYISRILALLNPKWSDVVDSGMISFASLLEQYRALPEKVRAEVKTKVQAEGRSKITSTDLKKARDGMKAPGRVSVDPELARSVDQMLEANTPKGEHYHPPKTQFTDAGITTPIIPSGVENVNAGLIDKRTLRITARQLKMLVEKSAVTGKEKGLMVELILPVEDLKRMHKKIGGKLPETDSLLQAAFMDQLNSI
ncbi:ParB/RepB/Spo0J family partition protein [Cupriavidus basilensis]|uniref:ParB/RepB/Spo0J family partition protein n=1 Tax=Cupriavidus basilensis TaxID=68895 RepID=A0A643FTV7_9BURK|nr:ParB/RepB/Spo0J family partition protein [Cupriavidus basilensis]QOT82262.1 ParB/RepB/Spo0J family partition protein [Cupriavidus basilensis]